jgi:nucleotide-binding universal stress UspA family protein
MKKILVPTDFSEEADKALSYVRHLAEKFGAEIHFLHVMESVNTVGSGLFPSVPAVDQELDLFTMKLMEIRSQELKQRSLSSLFIGIDTVQQIVVGDFFAVTKNYIEENQIDLVVMGSKGVSGLDEIFSGSNAEKIVRLSTAPVLVVKEDLEFYDPKKILFPTDCASGNEKTIGILNLFANVFGAEIEVLHVNTPSNFYSTTSSTKMLTDFVAENHLHNASVKSINDISEEEGILSYAADNHFDMIVMSTRGRKGFSRIVSGSVATDVVNHSKLPVLVSKLAQL